MKYATSATVLALGLAILIWALMPRYYLIFAFPDSPVVQMGPFATQSGCENGRHRLTEAVLGNNDPAHESERNSISRFMICVSSR